MTGGIFTGLENALMNGLKSVLQGQINLYSLMMTGLVTSSVTLYIIWRGYQTLGGKLNSPIEDIVWDLARMGIILVFVINIEGYLDASIEAINSLKSGLSGSENVWVLLDEMWEKVQILGSNLMSLDKSTYVKMDGAIGEILVWIGSIFTLAIATVVNLGAELTLLLMTTTAPIFIFCLMFGFLRPMFNNWLQSILSCILTLMFSALSLRIAIEYLSRLLAKAAILADSSNIITIGAQACLAGIGAGFVVWLSAKIAGSLAGASVQGVMQGAAKIGAIASGNMMKRTAKAVGQPTRRALNSMGEQATRNLNGTTGKQARASAKAAVKRMKLQNT